MVATVRNNATLELMHLADTARVPRLRSLLEFAEQDVVIPTGQFKGRRYRTHRHPAATLFLRELGRKMEGTDARLRSRFRWPRVAVTGPVQDGKSFQAVVIPTLYHVFEQQYTLVIGGPNEDTLKDKWFRDLQPAIMASPKLRAMLPRTGAGSKGAFAPLITLRNGGGFRFMMGTSKDEGRSGFTAEVALITEVDKMDTPGAGSRETDKVRQIEARTDFFRKRGRARSYLECTSSIPEGRITQEIHKGSDASPRLHCPHCGGYVLILREHLVGWIGADSEQQVRDEAHLVCPSCGAAWTEDDREHAIRNAVLCHRGQEVLPSGEVVGELPPTSTFGYRWTAADSLFKDIGDIAVREWNKLRVEEPENEEKELCQFVWARPYKPEDEDLKPLGVSDVLRRVTHNPLWTLGRVPAGTRWLVAGLDVGKYWLHWTVLAVFGDRRRHVVAYDKIAVESEKLETPDAIELALGEFHKLCSEGWPMAWPDQPMTDEEAEAYDREHRMKPALVGYDARYETDAVCRYLVNVNEPNVHVASMGFGIGQDVRSGSRGQYREPTDKDLETGRCLLVGERYKIIPRAGYPGIHQLDFDADRSKIRVQDALRLDFETKTGAMSLPYTPRPIEHSPFARHIVAERPERIFKPGTGVVTKMVAVSKQNHHGDATGIANTLGELCLMLDEQDQTPTPGPGPGPGNSAADQDAAEHTTAAPITDYRVTDGGAYGIHNPMQ